MMMIQVSDDFDIKQLIIKIINSANDFAVYWIIAGIATS